MTSFIKGFIFSLLVSLATSAFAGSVDTVVIFSKRMNKSIKAVVIKPTGYGLKKENYPVLYLLHGYDGSYNNWIMRVPVLKGYADTYKILIVCPDGGKNSWYFDSPVDSAMRYETYISKEVVQYIDRNYKTRAGPKNRAITGLSMGGHGALFIAFRNQTIFGAAGSMSGVVDLSERKKSYDLRDRLGDTILHARNWKEMSVTGMIEHYLPSKLQVIIDCGLKDPFLLANRRLHFKLLELKFPHYYAEAPGGHDWEYWVNALSQQLLFFHRFFRSPGK